MFDPNEADMILPEGFDPNAEEQVFMGDTADEAPAAEATPTTEQPAAEPEPPATPESEPATQEPTTTPEPEQVPPPAPQTIKVRYDREDREITLDEARIYAQKGMNYDRIAQRASEQEGRLSRYEQMAKMFGFDNAEAMMTQAEQNFIETKVKDLVDQGNSEAVSRFLVSQEMATLRKSQPQSPAQEQTGMTAERRAELEEFNAAYPDVTKIPDEVFAMHQNGTRLKTAYEIYTNKLALARAEAEKKAALDELAILKQNQAAAAKGPVTGTVGKAEPEKPEAEDPFLKGFNLGI